MLRRRTVILLYHRVASHRPDPRLLCVSPEHFAEHLQVIASDYHAEPLGHPHAETGRRRPFGKTVVVTLDDGYADNCWNAKPLLEDLGLPATVFVSSGYVDTNKELPSDVLERCLLGTARLPPSLTLEIGGGAHTWSIDSAVEPADAWNVTMECDPTSRHTCYRDIHRLLRPLGSDERAKVLDELAEWASSTGGRDDRRVMSSAELGSWRDSGQLEVGSHGVHHLLFATQPPDVQRREIDASKKRLQEILDRPVETFAYPYGGQRDIGVDSPSLVREAAYSLACSNVPGIATPGSDPFWLPRHLVRDWDGDEFARRLRLAFRG